MKLSGFGLVGLAAIIWGCGAKGTSGYEPRAVEKIEPAAVAAGEEHRLMPLKPGNSWTYQLEHQAIVQGANPASNKMPLEYKVVSVEDRPNGKFAVLEMSSEGKVLDRQEWLLNSKGLYQLSIGGEKKVPFSTPQPVWLVPLTEHEEFEWRGKGMAPDGQPANLIIKTKQLSPQEVDSEVKRYSAIPFESTTEFSGNNRKGFSTSTSWFVPDVGIVRFKQDVVVGNRRSSTLLKLQSANVQ